MELLSNKSGQKSPGNKQRKKPSQGTPTQKNNNFIYHDFSDLTGRNRR